MIALELPQRLDISDADDEDHLWCCRRDLAMCGAEIDAAGSEDEEYDDEDIPELCESCRWVEATNAPCPAALCKLRRRVARWRSR